ncbi:pyridoxal phosphate-dependent transferase [Limtongia smithiae]|uniref:pyridoxal phosphate-dependent transferase n=1 Tax=Limtongia smithiae TaxID=1125753 RepID=UPI0034CF23A2
MPPRLHLHLTMPRSPSLLKYSRPNIFGRYPDMSTTTTVTAPAPAAAAIAFTPDFDPAAPASSVVLPTPNPLIANQAKDVWTIVNEAAAEAQSSLPFPVLNLGQGFFSYNPPEFAIRAAQAALNDVSCNQYSHTRGRPSLRQALAAAYEPSLKRKINWETDVVVTSGANEGMFAAFTAFLGQGDEVIVFEPFFDQYISNIELPGGKVVYTPLIPPPDNDQRTVSSREWTVDFADLEAKISSRTKMIVVNSPHNPIGKVFSREELERIGTLAVKHNIIVLADEVYDRLYYTEFTRLATLSPALGKLTLTVGSAGKTFAATGWRVGWLIGPPELIKYVAAAHTRICFCVNSPLQEGTAVALREASLPENTFFADHVKAYTSKLARFNKVWDELGLTYTAPEGGYFVLVNFNKVRIPADYVFPEDIAEATSTRAKDFRMAYWLIRELGVVTIPPSEFYLPMHAHLADKYLRFAVCKTDDYLDQAVERLRLLKPYIHSD